MSAFPLIPLRAVTLDAQTGPFGSQLHSDEYVDDGIPVINPSNIINSKIAPDPAIAITKETSERLARHRLEPGDLVFARRGELGRAAVAHNEAVGWLCGTGSLRVRTRQSALDSRFAEYVLQSASTRSYFEMYAVGSTMGNLNTSIVLGLPIPLPPLDEQRRIADLLDAETARIDEAIVLITRQSKVLDQRYQVTIDAETQNAEELIPLKYIASIVDTEHKTAPAVPGGGYWIAGTSSVRRGRIDHSALYETDELSFREWTSRRHPRPGDVLLSREAPVGEVGLYRAEDPQLAIGQRMVLLSPHSKRVLSDYLTWTLLCSRTRRFIDDVTQGSLHPHLNMSDIGSIPVSNISLSHQETAVRRLSTIIGEIETLESLRRSQLKLLAERRQALITAAVTGGISI